MGIVMIQNGKKKLLTRKFVMLEIVFLGACQNYISSLNYNQLELLIVVSHLN